MVETLEKEVATYISFNDLSNSFVVGTNLGFWIYTIEPVFSIIKNRRIAGGVKLVQMFGLSNLLIFVPAGDDHTSYIVYLWCEK